MDASNGNSLEAHAFLQLIISFGIAYVFIWGGVIQANSSGISTSSSVDLCRYLGYTYLSYLQIKIFVYNIYTIN